MPIKRFIAGAVCQQCGIQDRVRAWEDEGEKLMRRECVSCGHEDVIALEVTGQPELVTRVKLHRFSIRRRCETCQDFGCVGIERFLISSTTAGRRNPKEMDRMTAKIRKAAINWSSESVPIYHRLPTHPHVVARHIATHISNVLVSPINTPSNQ